MSINCEFYYDGVTVTSFINIATLPLKSSPDEQLAVIRFFVGKRTCHTLPAVRTWPPVTCHLFGPMKKMLGGHKFA